MNVIIKKIGNFTQGYSVVVRFVSSGNATVEYDGDVLKLESGMLLGENALVKTGTSFVELADIDGNLYRLGTDIQFCLEFTIKGIVPVYYGKVHFESLYPTAGIHKYRTSCWTGKNTTVTIEICGNDSDIYYAYDRPVEIFEFDEQGKQFSLMYLEPFQKGKLKFDLNKPMRERYSVVEISDLTADECNYFYRMYKMPVNWGESRLKFEKISEQII